MSIEDLSPLQDRLDLGEARRPEYGPIWLDLTSRSLRMEGSDERVHLTPNQYQTLWLLVRAQGRPVSVGDMIQFVYDDENKDIPLSNTSDVHLAQIREKLSALTQGKVQVVNRHDLGYALELT